MAASGYYCDDTSEIPPTNSPYGGWSVITLFKSANEDGDSIASCLSVPAVEVDRDCPVCVTVHLATFRDSRGS